MHKYRLYRKAYRTLEHATPLNFDCGLLCRSKCCSGSIDDGMHLYPGEESMHKHQKEFLELREENFNDRMISFAVCSGKCNRRFRPLACRIYPFAPYIAEDGSLHIVKDPRAHYHCPLLSIEEFMMSGIFKRKVRDTFHMLIQDPDIREYVADLSAVLEEYAAFTGSLLPGN